MSDKKKRFFRPKADDSKAIPRQVTNLGPAGIFMPDYHKGQDMVPQLLRFSESWNAYVAVNFHPSLESIVRNKKLPELPKVDIAAIKPTGYDASDPIQVIMFETQLRAVVTENTKESMKIQGECVVYFNTLWLQLGLSFRNTIKILKDFEAAEKAKNPVWLWSAFEATCHGVVRTEKADSLAEALLLLTGLHKRKFEDIHSFYLRWCEAYRAYIAADGPVLSAQVQINLFNNSLDDGYDEYRTTFTNKKTWGEDLPGTLEANFQAAANFLSKGTVSKPGEQRTVFFTADEHANKQRLKDKKDRKGQKEQSGTQVDTKADSKKPGRLSKEEWLRTITCHACLKTGHLMKNCPMIQDAAADGTVSGAKVTACRMIAWSSQIPNKFLVAIDNCAYTSVFCNSDYVSDMCIEKCPPLLNWNGESFSNESHGFVHPFGYCEFNPRAPVNLLSEFEVKSRFDFVEEKLKSLTVFVGAVEVKFNYDLERRQFICDWRDYKNLFSFSPRSKVVGVIINSVAQNEAMYTKQEVALAKQARAKIAHTGYMSKEEIFRLASSSGNLVNWNLNRADVQRAIDIYGEQNVLHGRSRLIKPSTRIIRAEAIPKRPQDLFVDTMYVAGIPFLLCRVNPLGVLLCKHLLGENETHIGNAFEEFVSILLSYKYTVDTIYSDVDAAVVANINAHGKVRIENCAAGDHVNEAENPITSVKERYRSVKAGLDFTLFKQLVIELVLFVISRMNLCISQHATDGLCPKVRLTGLLVDAEKDLRIGFGHLVVARNKNVKSNDANQVRGEVCLTLRPVGNRQGSWRLLKLINGKIVSRSQFKEVPMTDLAKARLDELAARCESSNTIGENETVDYDEPEDDDDSDYADQSNDIELDFPLSSSLLNLSDNTVQAVQVPQLNSSVPVESVEVPHVHEDDVPASVDDVHEDDGDVPMIDPDSKIRPVSRYTEGSRRRWDKTFSSKKSGAGNNFVGMGIYNITPKQAVLKFGAQNSIKSYYDELKSLHENGTFEGILWRSLNRERKRHLIRSFLLQREKCNAEGLVEKLKSRLVANGAQMDAKSISNKSSPTVQLSLLFIMCAIAAREGREVATMDVGNAFVKATMDGEEEVLVVLDKLSAALLIKIDPSYEKFLNDKEEMVVKLRKALYGCIQSARLWYETLKSLLISESYTVNEHDPCIFNKMVNGKQSTLLVHVDDIKVLSAIKGEAKRLYSALLAKFGKVTFHEGLKHNYLGMIFDYSVAGKVSISMEGFEKQLVKDWNAVLLDLKEQPRRNSSAASPAANNIFDKGSGDSLDERKSSIFHSYVMRVAYLAKRVKPELNIPISYLSTQLTNPNSNDWSKLDRVINYVSMHIGEGIVLNATGVGKSITVKGFIDASFGCHSDGKSHTGVVVTLGDGPVYVRSVKQRIVTKSSTEAELVALSDESGALIDIKMFLISQGYDVNLIIAQDNQSTISMITSAKRESLRTKHINIRYYWLKERIDAGEFNLIYVPTGAMLADLLTKAVQGNYFRNFVRHVAGRYDVHPPAVGSHQGGVSI